LVRRLAEDPLAIELEGEEDVLSFRFDRLNESSIVCVARRMELWVSAILTAPVPPKAVDRALGITSRERIRWYKDGRLRICGRYPFGYSARVRVPFFVFADIARLQGAPEVIEDWRKEDSAQSIA
jgi:hypothetical protein